MRVAHLVSHPIQYFVPLYKVLSKRTDISLKVFFYSGSSFREHFDDGFRRWINWDIDLTGEYDYSLSPSAQRRDPASGFDWHLDVSIVRELAEGRFDVIWIHGYSAVNALAAMMLGYWMRIPVFLRDDANLLSPRNRIRKTLKRMVLPLMLRAVVPLYVSATNRQFFESYGADRIYPFCYSVDNDSWRSRRVELAAHRRAIRLQYGIDDDSPVVLFCGKLISRKDPLLLLEAFEIVRRTRQCHLLLAGEGDLRQELESAVRQRSIPDVHLSGFLNQTELARAYVISDILVLPSVVNEPWGMVVNEAMNFELPIIVSSRVGCANELVLDGVNGYVFDAGNREELADRLDRLVCSLEVRQSFGQKSRQIVSRYSLEESAEQLCEAFKREASQRRTG